MMRSIVLSVLNWSRRVDGWLVAGISLLLLAGLLMQYSISTSTDPTGHAQFVRQVIYIVIGSGLFTFFSIFDQRTVRVQVYWWWIACAVLLVAVLLFGRTIQGTTGWFIIGGVSLQPVELVKLLYILFIAHYFERGLTLMRESRHAIITGAATAALVVLVLGQPDLGSATILFLLWFCFALALRAPKWILVATVIATIAFGVLGWFTFFDQYQKDRLSVFLNPEAYAADEGYNVIQSMVAVGNGGLWGQGLGFGSQSQLHFLPEVSTDFIFAAFAEEFGFLGVGILLSSIGIIVVRCWLYIRRTRDPYVALLCLGSLLYLTIQSTMIIGMNIGVLPVTGVPLPFVSAGGSSLLMTMSLFGMVHHQFVSGRVSKTV